jgi:hypothetical protein
LDPIAPAYRLRERLRETPSAPGAKTLARTMCEHAATRAERAVTGIERAATVME